MITRALAISALALAAAIAAPASATEIDLTYSGYGTDTSLLLNSPSDGSTVTFISGTRNGVAITGLSSFDGADNGVSYSDPYVDFNGLSFTVTGGDSINLYDSIDGYLEYDSDAGASTGVTIAVTPVAVAEPATWGMMILGFAVAGFAIRRRHLASRVSYAFANL